MIIHNQFQKKDVEALLQFSPWNAQRALEKTKMQKGFYKSSKIKQVSVQAKKSPGFFFFTVPIP